jgi:hypothetical protein
MASGVLRRIRSWQVFFAVLCVQVELARAAAQGTVIVGGGARGIDSNQLYSPMGVDYDGDILYIADTFNHRVQRCIAPQDCTTVLGVAGERGNTTPLLYEPYNVRLATNDKFYITSTQASQVVRMNPLDSSPTWTQVIGLDNLNRATGFALSETYNYILVTDTANHVIKRFKWDVDTGVVGSGEIIAGAFGVNSSALNRFNNPVAIYLDESTEDIWVADSRNNRIVRWPNGSSTGILEAEMGGRPYGVVLTNGALYYSDYDECVVYKRINNDTFVFAGTLNICISGNKYLHNPAGLHVTDDAVVTIADAGNNRVIAWTPQPSSGSIICTFSAQCVVELKNSNPTSRNLLIIIRDEANSTCGSFCVPSGLTGETWRNATVAIPQPPDYTTVQFQLGAPMAGDLATYRMCWASDADQSDWLASSIDQNGRIDCRKFKYDVGTLTTELHIDQDEDGLNNQCIKGAPCQITIRGYALPDDLKFMSPPTSDWAGTCGDSYQNNFLGYRESIGRNPAEVLSTTQPLWNVTQCVPKNDDYTGPCNCSTVFNASTNNCTLKTFYNLTTEIMVDFGDASGGGPGLVPLCMCRLGTRCTAPYTFIYAAGFLRIRSVYEGDRFYCYLNQTCSAALNGTFLLSTDIAQIRDLRDSDCGVKRIGTFNLTDIFPHDTVPVSNLRDVTGVTGAMNIDLELGLVSRDGRYKICYCATYDTDDQTDIGDTPCDSDIEFTMSAGNLDILHVYQETYECPVTHTCNISVFGIDLVNQSLFYGSDVGPDKIMVDLGGPEICGVVFPLEDPLIGDGNVRTLAYGNTTFSYFDLGQFAAPGPLQLCYCTSFVWNPGGTYGGSCNDIMEFYQPLGTLYIRGPQRATLPCLADENCTIDVPGTKLSGRDRLMVCDSHSSCGNTSICAQVSPGALTGLLAPSAVASGDSTATFNLGVLTHAAYALCYCAAGNESSPTSLNCVSAAALDMSAGFVRVRGCDKDQLFSCIADAACSFDVYGFDLSATDHIMIANISNTCGTTEAISNRLFAPLSTIQATQGTAPTDRRLFDFRQAKQAGHFRVCYCARATCSEPAHFHLDAGILFVKGLFASPSEYLCGVTENCGILIQGYGLKSDTDAISVIPVKMPCGGLQVVVEGDDNATGLMNGVYEKGEGLQDARNWYYRDGYDQFLFYDVFKGRWILGPAREPDIPDEPGYAFAYGQLAKTPELGIPDNTWKRYEPATNYGFAGWKTDSDLVVRSVRADGAFTRNPTNITTDRVVDDVLKAPYLRQERFDLGIANIIGHYKICYCPSLATNILYYDNLPCTADDEFPGDVDIVLVQAVRGYEHYHCSFGGLCKVTTVLTAPMNGTMAAALLPAGAICYQAAGAGIEAIVWNASSWILYGDIINGELVFDLDRGKIEGVFEVCICTNYDSGSDGVCNNLEEFFQSAGDLTIMNIVRFNKDLGDESTTSFNLTWGKNLYPEYRLKYTTGNDCVFTDVSDALSPTQVATSGTWAAFPIREGDLETASGIISACLCPNWDSSDSGNTACDSGEEFYARVGQIVVTIVKSFSTVSSASSVMNLQMSVQKTYSSAGISAADANSPLFGSFAGGRRLNATANFTATEHRTLGITHDAAFAEAIANAIQQSATAILGANSSSISATVTSIQELSRTAESTSRDSVRVGVNFQIRLDGNSETHNLDQIPGCDSMQPLSSSCAAQATLNTQTLACYNERQALLKCLAIGSVCNGTRGEDMLSRVTTILTADSIPGVFSVAATQVEYPTLPSLGNTLEQIVCSANQSECVLPVSARSASVLNDGDQLILISGNSLCGPAPGWEGDVTPQQRAAPGFGEQPLNVSNVASHTFQIASPQKIGIYTLCYCWRGSNKNLPCTSNDNFYQSCGTLIVRGPYDISRSPCKAHSDCSPLITGVDLSPYDRVHLIASDGVCGQATPIAAPTVEYSPAAAASGSLQIGSLLPTGEAPQGASSMRVNLGRVETRGTFKLCYCLSGGSSSQTSSSCDATSEFVAYAGILIIRGPASFASSVRAECFKVDQVLPDGGCTFSISGTDIWLGADGIMILPVPGPQCGKALQSVDIVPNPLKLELGDNAAMQLSSFPTPRNYTNGAKFGFTSATKEGVYRICSCSADSFEFCTPDGVLGTRTTGIYMNFMYELGLLVVRGVVGGQLIMCREGFDCTFEVSGSALQATDMIEVLGPSESCGWEHPRSNKVSRSVVNPTEILFDGLGARFNVGTVLEDIRGESVSMRLCYCASVDNNNDGEACSSSTEFTHAVGFINTVICPEDLGTDEYSPRVQDVVGEAGYPSIRLFTVEETLCTTSGVGLSARERLGQALPLHSVADFNESVIISSALGGCVEGVDAMGAKMNMEQLAKVSVAIVYKEGEETHQDVLRLSHGHKIKVEAIAVDLSGSRYTCPAQEVQLVPFACTEISALIYGVALHGLFFAVVCCAKMKSQLKVVFIWSSFLGEIAKEAKHAEMQNDAGTRAQMRGNKGQQADATPKKQGLVRRVLSIRSRLKGVKQTDDKRGSTAGSADKDMKMLTDMTSPRGKNSRIQIDPKAAATRFDAWLLERNIRNADYRGDAEKGLTGQLAEPKLCIFIGLFRVGCVVAHMLMMTTISSEDTSDGALTYTGVKEIACLFLAPLGFVLISMIGQALLIRRSRDSRSMFAAFGTEDAFQSAASIAKVHLDLALPMLTRKHHCELWRFAVVAILSSLAVQFVLPGLYFFLSLYPLRHEVDDSLIQLGLPTLTAIDKLPEKPEEEEEDLEMPDSPAKRNVSKDTMDAETREMKDTILCIKEREQEFPALQRIRAAWAKDLKASMRQKSKISSDRPTPMSSGQLSGGSAKAIEDTSDGTDSRQEAQELQLTDSKQVQVQGQLSDGTKLQPGAESEEAPKAYSGLGGSIHLYRTRIKWSREVSKSQACQSAPEEVLRHRLISALDFLEGSGWYMVTRAARSSISPVAGTCTEKHEAWWTMLLVMFGGIDMTVLHFCFLTGYYARLEPWEYAGVFTACFLGLFQATRPKIVEAMLDTLAEVAPGESQTFLWMLVLVLFRFVVSWYGLSPGCPNFTWPFVAVGCSVAVVEYPILLAYRFSRKYKAVLQWWKLRSVLKLAKYGPPEQPVIIKTTEKEMRNSPAPGKKWLGHAPSLAPAFAQMAAEKKPQEPEKPARYTTRNDPQVAAWLKIIEGNPIAGLRGNMETRIDALRRVSTSIDDVIAGVDGESKEGAPILRALNDLRMLGYYELRRAQMANRVMQLASSEHFRHGCLASRARLVQAGLARTGKAHALADKHSPEIRLLHWEEIARLGELPRFDAKSEKNMRSAADVFKDFGHNAIMIPVIHRWRGEEHPDPDGVTARQLITFALWYQKQWGPDVEPFFWIDYCCLPETSRESESQQSMWMSSPLRGGRTAIALAKSVAKAAEAGPTEMEQPSIWTEISANKDINIFSGILREVDVDAYDALLPLLYAASDAVLICEAKDSEQRAWVRMETILAYKFAPSCRKIYAVDHKLGNVRVRRKAPRSRADLSPKSGGGEPRSPTSHLPGIEEERSESERAGTPDTVNHLQISVNQSRNRPGNLVINTEDLDKATFDRMSPSSGTMSGSGRRAYEAEDLKESAMQALERTETRLSNNLIADPQEWDIVDTSLHGDRVRIHQLMRVCLAEAPLYMPGGMRRPPVVFGRSILHVCRLECTKRTQQKRRRSLPPLTPKGQTKLNDLMRSPSSSEFNPMASVDTVGFSDAITEEDEPTDDDEEQLDEREASDKEPDDAQEALEALSLRKDRNAPLNEPTRVCAHVRQMVDWEEKAKELYFQTNWFKKEKKIQSWDVPSDDEQEEDLDRKPSSLSMTKQKTGISMAATTSVRSTRVQPKVPGAIGSPPSPVRLPAGLQGLPPPEDLISPKSSFYDGSPTNRSSTNLRKSAMAQDTTAGTKGRKAFAAAPDVPKQPKSAMNYLMARADQARSAHPESREPLPSFPMDHITEDCFHPVFLSPAMRLSDGGRVASQMKATGNTAGLPWLSMPLSPKAAADPIGALPSGGLAVARNLVPVRKGVFPEAPAVHGVSFSVKIEAVDDRWNDGLGIGFTAQDPDAWPEGRSRPRHAASLTSTWMCGHTGRWRLNGMDELIKPYCGKTWRPGKLKVGDVVTIAAATAPIDMMRILVNGKAVAEREASSAGLSSDHIARLRGVVDVEGSACSVRLGVGGATPFGDAPGNPDASERPKSSLATSTSNWRPRVATASSVSSPSPKPSNAPQEVATPVD